MEKVLITRAGNAPEIFKTHVVALYHPSNGKIAQVHTVTIFKGGREVTPEEAIETAKHHARKNGHNVEELKIKLSNDPVHGFHPHRIDINKDEFIAINIPKKK